MKVVQGFGSRLFWGFSVFQGFGRPRGAEGGGPKKSQNDTGRKPRRLVQRDPRKGQIVVRSETGLVQNYPPWR